MKMAKASEADISMAMTMANILDDIERGYFPAKLASDPESEDSEFLDTDDREQYCRLIDGLQRVLNQGSIFRVIFGMAVVCDPNNELLDPTSDVLAVHPKLTLALEQRDELLAALDAFISEHEECEDADGWMAFMCSPEAFHVASEAADSVKAATCGEPGKPAKTERSDGSPA